MRNAERSCSVRAASLTFSPFFPPSPAILASTAMSLSSVGVQHADLPGAVDAPYRQHASRAIGRPPPPPTHTAAAAAPQPPHLQQHWAQHVSTLHTHAHMNSHARHFPLPPPLLHSHSAHGAQPQQPAAASPSPAPSTRPSLFLLSLRIGDEVDALDEIGYRQWRHAFVLELGHLPGQTVDDSGQVGEYKIRWAGWDAKWDEWVHGGRLAALNSKVLGDTGPEAVSEKESAWRIGKEWKAARQQGILTDVAITFPLPSDERADGSGSSGGVGAASVGRHARSLSVEDHVSAPLMLAHLALLSVRCPSLLSMFSEDSADDPLVSYQLHPQTDVGAAPTVTVSRVAEEESSLDDDELAVALPPPTSARMHSEALSSSVGGWRRGRLSTPAGVRAAGNGRLTDGMVTVDSPRSARPSTADASTTRAQRMSALTPQPAPASLHHHSVSASSTMSLQSRAVSSTAASSSSPRRALNFSDVPAAASHGRRAKKASAHVPINRSRHNLAPATASLSASAPTSPLTQVKSAAEPPTLRAVGDKAKAEEGLESEVRATVAAMTSAVELVDGIRDQTLEYADSDQEEADDESKELDEEKEEKAPRKDDVRGEKEEKHFVPLASSASSASSSPPTPSTSCPSPSSPLIPVFCVPGIRTYAALRAFVEFVYTDAFDSSVSNKRPAREAANRAAVASATQRRNNAMAATQAAVAEAAADILPARVRQTVVNRLNLLNEPRLREVGVGGAAGLDGEDSDEERLGLMDAQLDDIDDELVHAAIAARYRRHLTLQAHAQLQQIAQVNRPQTSDEPARLAEAEDEADAEPNPAHVLSMSDLFDLACIGSRFHFPRLIALCASQLSSELSIDNIMQALRLCVSVGCLGGDEEDILQSIFASSSSSLLPPSSVAPPSSSSLPSHRAHDLSIMLRIAFDFLSFHWDSVMKHDSSVKILHTLPFPAFSAVVQVKGRSINSSIGTGRYVPPVVHHPASRLVRDIKQLYLQRGSPPSSADASSTSSAASTPTTSASTSLLLATTHSPCDFCILVGDTVHWAHRSVLACRSEYFRALFSSRMAETAQSSITFPLSLQSGESIAALLRYLYYDDAATLSYEAALYLLHHCTDFFGLSCDQLEKACERLIMDTVEGGKDTQPGSAGSSGVGLVEVVRMSWRMQKWPLFERAVKFLDWKGLEALINQPAPLSFASSSASSTSASMVASVAASVSASPALRPHTLASSSVASASAHVADEKSNDEAAAASVHTSASATPPRPSLLPVDIELVRAVVSEKATPGVTMALRGGGSSVKSGGRAQADGASEEASRRDSLSIQGVGLLRRADRAAGRGAPDEGEIEEELMADMDGNAVDGELEDEEEEEEEDDDDDDLDDEVDDEEVRAGRGGVGRMRGVPLTFSEQVEQMMRAHLDR